MLNQIKKTVLSCLIFLLVFNILAKEKTSTVKIYLAGGTSEIASTRDVIKKFTDKNPNIEVEAIRAPNDTNEMYKYYLQIFEAKSGDMDVICLDTSWARDLAEHLIDLSKFLPKNTFTKYYPVIMDSYEIDKKYVALPWYSDIGLLYYRKDLLKKYKLKVPQTWIEFTKAAFIIQQGERKAGNNDFEGFVFQGQAYEGLTCNAIEWIYNNDGGTIINIDKKNTINNKNSIAALELAANWIGTIAPRGVLDMTEEESKNAFMSGNVAFIRSWPYLYSLCGIKDSVIKGKYDATLIPTGKLGKNSGVLGGWGIGINKYSNNKEAAVKLVEFITSTEAQKYRALKSGNAPNIIELKNDKDLMKIPVFRVINKAFETGFNRPFIQAFPNYNAVSQVFYRTVNNVLKKEITAFAAVQEMQKQITNITNDKTK